MRPFAGSVLSSAAVFVVVVILALVATTFLLQVVPSDMLEELGITSALLAAGLPVPIGVLVSARFARGSDSIHRSDSVVSITGRDVALCLATAAGAILVTPFGGWVAGFFFLAYFVTAAALGAVLSVRAGHPPFSTRTSAILGGAVVLAAVLLGFLLVPLLDLAMRMT